MSELSPQRQVNEQARAFRKRLRVVWTGWSCNYLTASILLVALITWDRTGWPERGAEGVSSSQSYAAAGCGAAVGREFSEAHVRACLHAGLRISGSFHPVSARLRSPGCSAHRLMAP